VAQVGVSAFGFGLFYRVTRIPLRVFLWVAAIFGVLAFTALVLVLRFSSPPKGDPEMVRVVREAASRRSLACRLTKLNELIRLRDLPEPYRQWHEKAWTGAELARMVEEGLH
jgi:hypothetical protein